MKKIYMQPQTVVLNTELKTSVLIVSGPNVSTNPADKGISVDTKTSGDWSDIWK